jgi:hypothetical protein
MLLHDFSDRAEEFLRLAQRTRSPHDRTLFTELARACYGVEEEAPPAPCVRPTPTH